MHPACSIKRGVLLACCISLGIALNGCKKEVNPISLGEWIQTLDEEAGIQEFTQEKPYYLNVPKENRYYPYVQAGVEWKILDTDVSFDPNQSLTKEWAACTLMNLLGEPNENNVQIHDLKDTNFTAQIEAAVAKGLMPLDQRGCFHPKEVLERTDALHLLQQAVSFANTRTMPTTQPELDWKDNAAMTEVTPITFDERKKEGTFPSSAALKQGDIIYWKNAEKEICCYVVEDAIDQDDHQLVKVRDYEAEEQFESMRLSGSEELDFSKAQIYPGQAVITEQSSQNDSAQEHLTSMNIHPLRKEFTYHSFTIVVESSGSSIRARASRSMPHGTEIAADAILNHVNVNYAWNSKEHNLENAYFKIDFDSEEDVSIQNEKTKDLYGDFTKIKSGDFLSVLTKRYQDANDAEDTTLTLCKIVLPIPNAPVLNIVMSLELHLSATGKAELSLVQENTIGFETRDGHMRLIKNSTGKADASVKATTQILAGIRFGLNLLNGTLMDAGIHAGAKGTVQTTVHLYDDDGNMSDHITDVPADTCEQSAAKASNVLVCTDVNAHWVLNALINSSSSLAGKFGLSKEFDILDEDNAPLIPGLNHHYEDGVSVDHCTRKSRKYLSTADGILVTKRICLKEYSFTVKEGELHQIEIEALPEGYQENDLCYQSSNEDVVTVDGQGCVRGRNAGGAVITIKTNDDKHTIHCNVIVPVS